MNSFLDCYELYHNMRTDADAVFSKALAIQMLGHSMGYNAKHLITPGVVRHNMYLALIGTSTLSRKSTSQSIAKEVYPEHKNHSDDSSPEQFIEDLAKKPDGFYWFGEWTYLLKGINGHGYMSRMVEVMNHIFDCPSKFERNIKKNQKVITVEHPYLSFNTTCTPEMLEKYIDEEMTKGGFLARFIIYQGKPSKKPRRPLDPAISNLREKLRFVLAMVQKMNKHDTFFIFTDNALERFNEIEEELYKKEKILPFVGRYLNYIVAISDILFISDCLGYFLRGNTTDWNKRKTELVKLVKLVELVKLVPDIDYNLLISTIPTNATNLPNPTIPVAQEYVERAYEIVKPAIEYVEELVDYVDVELPVKKFTKFMHKHNGEEIKHSVAMRNSNLNAKEMDLARRTLVGQGLIEQYKKENAIYYRWIGGDK